MTGSANAGVATARPSSAAPNPRFLNLVPVLFCLIDAADPDLIRYSLHTQLTSAELSGRLSDRTEDRLED